MATIALATGNVIAAISKRGIPIEGSRLPARRSCALPEVAVALTAFLLHFAWEMLQSPLWVGMAELPHVEGLRICLIATFGDVAIALIAFWSVAAHRRDRRWMRNPTPFDRGVFITIGMLITIVLEYVLTSVLGRWQYANEQPVLPLIGTGIAPIAQWLIVPPLLLWLVRRQVWGALALRDAKRSKAG